MVRAHRRLHHGAKTYLPNEGRTARAEDETDHDGVEAGRSKSILSTWLSNPRQRSSLVYTISPESSRNTVVRGGRMANNLRNGGRGRTVPVRCPPRCP